MCVCRHEVHVDTSNEIGYTALSIACLSGSVQMMKVLLRYGARVREELLVCIDQDFKEGTILLLQKLTAFQGSFAVNQSVRLSLPSLKLISDWMKT